MPLGAGRALALHGCRQFVPRGLALGRLTNANCPARARARVAVTRDPLPPSWIWAWSPTLQQRKSSQYGLDGLGYTRATRATTTGCPREGGSYPQTWSQSGLRAATRAHEAEIVSNRASACRGEGCSGSAHTAHHARRVCPAGGSGGVLLPPLSRIARWVICAKLTQGSGRGTCRWKTRDRKSVV